MHQFSLRTQVSAKSSLQAILVWIFVMSIIGSLAVFHTHPVEAKPASEAASAAAGEHHSLVSRSDGSVWAFGSNEFGQLGVATNSGLAVANPAPRAIGLNNVSAVAAGGAHSLVLRSDGTVWAFGSNEFGQLGTPVNAGSTIANPTPMQVPVLGNIVAIAAGGAHSLALRSDGTVWAFGSNESGQLGTAVNAGTTTPTPTPRIIGLGSVNAVAAGRAHSLVLRTDGTLWAFGSNESGQLGSATNSGTSTPNVTPRQVLGAGAVRGVAAGGAHSLIVDAFGMVWAFGSNAAGQLGSPTSSGTSTPNPAPVQVPGLNNIAFVAAGASHSVVASSDRKMWAFGSNLSGQLGTTTNNGTGVANPTPTALIGLSNVERIAAGGSHTFALPLDGSVWGFGSNESGQLGSTKSMGGGESTPQRVIGVGKVAAGGVVKIHVSNTASAAVLGNLTLDQPEGGGFTTVYPCLEGRPTTSNSNFVPGETVANLVVVRADIGGDICVFSTTYAHVIWDQIATPTAFTATHVRRLLDTRLASKAAAGAEVRVHVSDTPSDTVLGNLTVDQPEGGGFATVYPCADGRTTASNVNFSSGQTLANFAAVRSDASGDICVYSTVAAHLLWDQVVATNSIIAGNAARLLDTRFTGKAAAGAVVRVHATDTPNATVLGNLTVDRPEGGGFTTVYPCSDGRPNTSNSNFVPEQTVANFVMARADAAGDLCMYTNASAHLIWDQVAATTAFTVGNVTRLVDTRT